MSGVEGPDAPRKSRQAAWTYGVEDAKSRKPANPQANGDLRHLQETAEPDARVRLRESYLQGYTAWWAI